MTTPIVQVRLNGGAWQSGGVDADPGDTVELRLSNASVFATFRWEIYGYPTGFAQPSGWSTDANGVYYRLTATPESWDTSDDPSFGKYLVRCTCDGDDEKLDETTAIRVQSRQGLNGIGEQETTQFSAVGGWAADLKTDLEKLGKVAPYVVEITLTGVVGITSQELFVLPKHFFITDVVAVLSAVVTGGSTTVDVSIGWSGDNLIQQIALDATTVLNTAFGVATSQAGSSLVVGNNYRLILDQSRTISAEIDVGVSNCTGGKLKIAVNGIQL